MNQKLQWISFVLFGLILWRLLFCCVTECGSWAKIGSNWSNYFVAVSILTVMECRCQGLYIQAKQREVSRGPYEFWKASMRYLRADSTERLGRTWQDITPTREYAFPWISFLRFLLESMLPRLSLLYNKINEKRKRLSLIQFVKRPWFRWTEAVETQFAKVTKPVRSLYTPAFLSRLLKFALFCNVHSFYRMYYPVFCCLVLEI